MYTYKASDRLRKCVLNRAELSDWLNKCVKCAPVQRSLKFP